MEDRWAKLEEIVRRVVREELSTWNPQKAKSRIGFKNGFFTGLGEIEMAALEATYPAVDVAKQIREAATWIMMNPGDAPRSNYGAFLNRWLGKHQQAHSMRVIPLPTKAAPPNLCVYCLSPSTGSTNGYRHCSARLCFDKAMSGDRPQKMPGVMAAPVAGLD
jgi:hypothetical protein